MTDFLIDGEAGPPLCVACEEPLKPGEEPYKENGATYHGKCAKMWRCSNCGKWNIYAVVVCVNCGDDR